MIEVIARRNKHSARFLSALFWTRGSASKAGGIITFLISSLILIWPKGLLDYDDDAHSRCSLSILQLGVFDGA
jgi:hypothetical protein